ncbi:MAG: hypothetical protein CL910_18240 [Deltaproteobacteria bacterium]|nr:hypothetical protein [Deltaproteobacteria bacterium]
MLAAIFVAVPPGHATRGAPSCKVLPPGVSLLILASPALVKSFASSVEGPDVVREDETTVVFDDGRVITADPDSAERFLNELGWGNLKLDIVASFPRAARRRAVG